MEKILESLNEVPSDPIIIAGHYCVSPNLSDLSSECETEENSFKAGVLLSQKRPSSKLVLFINDIGVDIKLRSSFKENYQFPENYLKVLNDHNLDPLQVHVVFESTVRNKASVVLRKKYKTNSEKFKVLNSSQEGLTRCIDKERCDLEQDKKAYVISGPDNKKSLVVKEGPNPKCNLILATLFHSVSKHSESSTMIINIFNAIYTNRIHLGKHVYEQLFDGRASFKNYFVEEDDLFLN